MSFGWNTKAGGFTSCGLDWVPFVGTAKGIYEGCYGKDSITGEKLSGFQRSMCFLGAIPIVGNACKSFVKSEKAIKNISRGAKGVKWADRAVGGYDIYDTATSNYDDKKSK